MTALTPEELQSLINRGVVSIRPPDPMTVKAMQEKAWREENRERYRETRRLAYERNKESRRAASKRRYEQKRKEELDKAKARYDSNKAWRLANRERYLASRNALYERKNDIRKKVSC
jgi:hypothetical protein